MNSQQAEDSQVGAVVNETDNPGIRFYESSGYRIKKGKRNNQRTEFRTDEKPGK